jgi:hypothetical protein
MKRVKFKKAGRWACADPRSPQFQVEKGEIKVLDDKTVKMLGNSIEVLGDAKEKQEEKDEPAEVPKSENPAKGNVLAGMKPWQR